MPFLEEFHDPCFSAQVRVYNPLKPIPETFDVEPQRPPAYAPFFLTPLRKMASSLGGEGLFRSPIHGDCTPHVGVLEREREMTPSVASLNAQTISQRKVESSLLPRVLVG